MNNIVTLKRKAKWKIILDSLMDWGIPVTINGIQYAFFKKGDIIDTVPPSEDQYEVLDTGFFALYSLEEDGKPLPSMWIHCTDSIKFLLMLDSKATDEEIAIIVGNMVLNQNKQKNRDN